MRGVRGVSPWQMLGGLALLALALPVVAQEPSGERVGRVTEVRQSEGEGYGSTILVDQGHQAGVAPGQTVEVRREGKVIGYGSVDTAFSDVAVATVGTVVTGASPLRPGDQVVFRGAGFQRPEAAAPPPPPDPTASGLPRGHVVSGHDGLVLIEFPEGQAPAEVGMEVSVQSADGKEHGRLVLELVNARTAGGLLVSGEASVGDVARVVARAARSDGEDIDYVALSFLGVVADLEHPTPHRAACHVGVPVRRVMPASPAQRAAITHGDRVIAIDGVVVRDITAIRERIEAREGNRLQVVVLRGDRVLSLEVVFR